jgi:hypothetical protein
MSGVPYYLASVVAITVIVVIVVIVGTGLWVAERHDRRRHAEADKVLEAAIAAEALVQIGDDADLTPYEPVEELPLRAQAIEVPREGAVLQGPWTVHDECLDAWSVRNHEGICGACSPVFGKAVKA